MPTPIDARVTPSLHSENVRQLDGYSDDSAPYLGPVMETLDDAYLTLAKIHDARDHASRNQAWTPEQAVIAVSDAAYKQQQRLAKKFDNVRATLDKQIAHFEQELSQPLESRASVGISGEIRKFVKDMTTEERHKFIQEAIDAGDHTTVSAVLGAPSYLSCHDAASAKIYTRFWHERATPEVATKLKAVRNAKAAIEERGALLFKEVEKAMGSTWGKVQELRQGNDKALAALKFGE